MCDTDRSTTMSNKKINVENDSTPFQLVSSKRKVPSHWAVNPHSMHVNWQMAATAHPQNGLHSPVDKDGGPQKAIIAEVYILITPKKNSFCRPRISSLTLSLGNYLTINSLNPSCAKRVFRYANVWYVNRWFLHSFTFLCVSVWLFA